MTTQKTKKKSVHSATKIIKKLKGTAAKEIAVIKKTAKKQIDDIQKVLAKKIMEHKKTPKIVKVGTQAAMKAKRTYKKAIAKLKGK